MRSSLPTPARLLRRTSCSGPRLRSPLLSVGTRASPSSTDQTPQARAPAWRARRRRSPDRGTRRRVSCLTPALPRRADRREGASCFGRNPSYDVRNNRAWRSLLRAHSSAWRSLRCYCSSVECESEPGAQEDARTSSIASACQEPLGAPGTVRERKRVAVPLGIRFAALPGASRRAFIARRGAAGSCRAAL
jgi:hypothetical protein